MLLCSTARNGAARFSFCCCLSALSSLSIEPLVPT